MHIRVVVDPKLKPFLCLQKTASHVFFVEGLSVFFVIVVAAMPQQPLQLSQSGGRILEVGCDEVGRGALAGPVVAAAVIWADAPDPEDRMWEGIRDSKKLSMAQRGRLADYIRETAIDFAIGEASSQEIDAQNILKATHTAMHRALDALQVDFDKILVDGDRFRQYMRRDGLDFVEHECIVAGDNKFVSIAAASILAKVHRDTLMEQLFHLHPVYEWRENKGYGTGAHIAAIRKQGPSEHHRSTFLRNITSS